MITVNTFFDKAIFTNCDHRTDRLAQFTEETAKFGIVAERFKRLVYHNPDNYPVWPDNFNTGVVGTILTMRNAIQDAKEQNLKNFLFFEDDAEFHPDFVNLFDKYIQQLPEDWCLIYLGGWHLADPISVTENISRVVTTYHVHAVGFHSRVYDTLLEIFNPPTICENGDVMLSHIQPTHPCYVFNPRLVFTRPCISDVWGHHVDFNSMLGRV